MRYYPQKPYYGQIRDPDTRNHPSMYFKVSGPIWVFHEIRLADPQDIMIAVLMVIIRVRILQNPPKRILKKKTIGQTEVVQKNWHVEYQGYIGG